MLIELLNTGVRKICQETYGGNRIAIGIYDFDQWPTITAQNLKHTGSWVGRKHFSLVDISENTSGTDRTFRATTDAGVEWQGLVAPAVPTKAEFQRGQWCAYIKGETYIAGPRALSLAQSSGKAVSTATMDRFRLINGPRGSGITVSECIVSLVSAIAKRDKLTNSHLLNR